MMIVVGTLLAVALTVQTQGRQLDGSVVDDQGKPVADAAVLFQQSAADQPANPQTQTDAAGRFRLTAPIAWSGRVSALWIYKPGLALAAVDPGRDIPGTITLKAPHRARSRSKDPTANRSEAPKSRRNLSCSSAAR